MRSCRSSEGDSGIYWRRTTRSGPPPPKQEDRRISYSWKSFTRRVRQWLLGGHNAKGFFDDRGDLVPVDTVSGRIEVDAEPFRERSLRRRWRLQKPVRFGGNQILLHARRRGPPERHPITVAV